MSVVSGHRARQVNAIGPARFFNHELDVQVRPELGRNGGFALSIRELEMDQVHLELDHEPLVSLRADLREDGTFGDSWLVISPAEACVLSSDHDVRIRVPISDIREAELDRGVGGGSLLLKTDVGPMVLARFSVGLYPKFGYAVTVLNALTKGEEVPLPSERDIPQVCPSCGRPLGEGTSVCPTCLDRGKVIRRLAGFARPYSGRLAVGGLILILATAFQLVPPYVTKLLVDNVLVPHQSSSFTKAVTYLLALVLTLFGVNLLGMLTQSLRGYIGVWCGSRITGDIRHKTYDALMKLSLSYFDRRQTSQFIGRVNSDANSMREFLTDGVVFLVSQILMVLAIAGVMLKMNWLLALLSFATIPLIIVASLVVWPMVHNLWDKQWRSILRLNVLVGDSLQGIRVVKAFGRESSEKSRYNTANQELVMQTTKMEGIWQGVFPMFAFLSSTGGLLVWYIGGRGVLHGTVTLGTLIAFNSYLGMFIGPLQWFSQFMNWLNNTLAAADRIFEILDAKSTVVDRPDTPSLGEVKGAVELQNVTFGYESHRPVLKEISIDVLPGEMIGLVGKSGAGKSTLINMICRFYDPDRGSILIDGHNLRDIQQEEWHKSIGVVLQETFLFDGTVAENISYAYPDATQENIMRVARIANAHSFIMKLPDGYDTLVGERGHLLSGGERQRIAIARALLHNPRILILDEATASLDNETERQIQEALARLVKGRTTFAIAHRLSTLRNADRLVVLDGGRIAEVGTHEELLEQKGAYFKLVEAQRELSKIRGVEG